MSQVGTARPGGLSGGPEVVSQVLGAQLWLLIPQTVFTSPSAWFSIPALATTSNFVVLCLIGCLAAPLNISPKRAALGPAPGPPMSMPPPRRTGNPARLPASAVLSGVELGDMHLIPVCPLLTVLRTGPAVIWPWSPPSLPKLQPSHIRVCFSPSRDLSHQGSHVRCCMDRPSGSPCHLCPRPFLGSGGTCTVAVLLTRAEGTRRRPEQELREVLLGRLGGEPAFWGEGACGGSRERCMAAPWVARRRSLLCSVELKASRGVEGGGSCSGPGPRLTPHRAKVHRRLAIKEGTSLRGRTQLPSL